jgi:hypothetical protein
MGLFEKKEHESISDDYLDKVETIDYVILGLIKNGITNYLSIFQSFKKIPKRKFQEHFNKLERLDLITIDSSESWVKRNSNPSIVLKTKGITLVEKKSNLSELIEIYVKC